MKAETRLMRETVMQELTAESPMPLSTLQVCERVMAGGRYTERGVLKPADALHFYRDKNARSGLFSWCKTCVNARPRPQTRTRLIRVRARNRAMQRLIDLHREQFEAIYESERADAIEEDERLSNDPENMARFDGQAPRLKKGRRRTDEDPEAARIDENWCASCSAYHSRDHHEKPERRVEAGLAEFNSGTERARRVGKGSS